MTYSLGSQAFAGNLMKTSYEDQGAYWEGTNLSGFSGLPGGYRSGSNGNFYYAGDYGYWWSSSPDGSNSWSRFLNYASGYVYRDFNDQRGGFSVRCVRDAE